MKRCRHYVVRDILAFCRFRDASINDVMERCGLSYSLTRRYLKLLTAIACLIKQEARREGKLITCYRTTFKGLELLKLINEVELFFDNPDAVFDIATATAK